MSDVQVRRAQLNDPDHQQAILTLLDHYARQPMGDGSPLADQVRQELIPRLRDQLGCRIFLAFVGEQPAGLVVCFLGFSTFRAQPLLNIHDVVVHSDFQKRGIGQSLMEAVEHDARAHGCCRITLEVRADNHVARRLYERVGFRAGQPHTEFWQKDLRLEAGDR